MGNKLTAAALGGLMIGFLAILRAIPGVGPFFACCGCLSTIVGGALAAALYIKRSPVRVRNGEGAMVGALAGMVGGLIQLFIVTPIQYFTGNYSFEFKNHGRQVESPMRRSLSS